MNAPVQLLAACTPNSYPHADGRVEHGYQITVLNQTAEEIVATMDLPDWERFDREAAGRHLGDAGFTLCASWEPAGLGYMASVVRAEGERSV